MFRVLAHRRVIVAAAAAVGVGNVSHDKLPIYPAPTPEVVLVETPSELEKQLGNVRRAVTARYEDAHAQVQGVVSHWIGVEHAVEKRVKSLIAPDEPLTPGILYVGVATLTGSVFTRNRGLFSRVLFPPALLLFSMDYFLPHTSHNISQYLGSLEERFFPTLAEKHEIAKAHSAMTVERVKDATLGARESFVSGVGAALQRAEQATGLKLKETMGWSKDVASAAKEQTLSAARVVAEKTEAAVESVKESTAAAVAAAETKTGAVVDDIAEKADVGRETIEQPPPKRSM